MIASIRHANRILRGRFERELWGVGASFAALEVLLTLDERSNLHTAGVARSLGISRQAAGRLIGNLEDAGLVEVLPKDGGLRGVALTQEGRVKAESAFDAVQPTLRRLAVVESSTRARLVEDLAECERVLRPRVMTWWPG